MSRTQRHDAGQTGPDRVAENRHTRRRLSVPLLIPSLVLLGSAFVALLTIQQPAEAQDNSAQGLDLFAANCASCHQAGGIGIPGTFPPLASNPNAVDPAYVADVIANGKTGPLEVDGVNYDSAMPAIPALTGADLDAVVDYVVGIAGAEAPAPAEAPEAGPIVGDSDRGHDLFIGADRFAEGGPACSACHTAGEVSNLGGWSLGPDLTNALDVVGGEVGFVGWMANPPAETMAPIFKDHPLNDQELADVAAYLAETPNQDIASGFDRLLLASIVGLVVLIGGMAFFWRGMRQTYVERLRSKR